MTEDRRVSRNPGEPPKSGPGGGARWAAYLDWCRSEVADGVLALAYDEQRRARVPSGWSPLELLSHVLHMEQRWFVWGFLGEPVDEPWGDWDVADPVERRDGRWAVPDGVKAETLEARLATVGARTRAVLADHDLSERAATGGRFGSTTDGDPPTLEWICFHVLAEYARHAGHLDIVVELSASN